MHIQKHFAETNTSSQANFIRSFPLATVVVLLEGKFEANPIPLLLREAETGDWILEGHVPGNSLLAAAQPNHSTLAIFQGPSAYISPGWYASKQADTRVVPTWNYAAIHLSGRLNVIHDSAWLSRHIRELTLFQESHFESPWKPEDAPEDFTEKLLRAIVGIELTVENVEAKFKLSQNQPLENRRSLLEGLKAQAKDESFASFYQAFLSSCDLAR